MIRPKNNTQSPDGLLPMISAPKMAKIGTERGFESGVGAEKGRRRCRGSRISVGKGKRCTCGEMTPNILGDQEIIAIFARRD